MAIETTYFWLDTSPGNGHSAHCFGMELPWAAAQLRMPMDHSQNTNTSALACRGRQTVAANKRWKERNRDLWGAVQQCDYFLSLALRIFNKCFCHVCPTAACRFLWMNEYEYVYFPAMGKLQYVTFALFLQIRIWKVQSRGGKYTHIRHLWC